LACVDRNVAPRNATQARGAKVTDHQRPRRPRQHQLESESRAAFHSVIPSLWVYRDLDQDYGIDSEVEIFDDSGAATGARFLVQLKATDEPDLKKALKLRLHYSKAQYYASLDLPVLIARFHAPSNRFYVRWFHNLDPYYGRQTQTGISFQLTAQDVWDEATPAHLVEDVEAFREMKAPRLHGPLRMSLSITGEEIHGVPVHQLRLKLHEAFRRVSHIVTLERADNVRHSWPHALIVNSERCEIRLGGTHGFTLHTPHGCVRGDASSTLHYDIMLGIGLALDWHGHSIEGAAVIESFWKNARLAKEIATAFPLARCLARANRMHSAIEIAEEFFGDDSTLNAAQTYLLPFLARQTLMTMSERDLLTRVLGRIALEVERRGDLLRASVLNYNCGNILRGTRRFRESVRHYRKAARLDAQYLNRSYFWRELAGVMFLARRYVVAAELYRRSLDIEDHRPTRALYADALMFSGKYREAEELFEAYLTIPVHPTDAEWALKCLAMSFLRAETGINEQRRSAPVFPEGFRPSELEETEIAQICGRALQQDALSPLAWFNWGGVHHRANELERAAKCFLMAALSVPWDLQAWGNVIAISMQTENTALFGHALVAAYMTNGEEFLSHMADRVRASRDEVVKMLASVVGDLIPKDDGATTVRIHHSGLGWDEVLVCPETQH
jgi:tetratricopeptide (TPR) repeat protein